MKNKKALYEQIMTSVAKEVKKALNELSSNTYLSAAEKQRERFNDDEFIADTDDEELLRQYDRINKFNDAAEQAKKREAQQDLLLSFKNRRQKVMDERRFKSEIVPQLDKFYDKYFTQDILDAAYNSVFANFDYEDYCYDVNEICDEDTQYKIGNDIIKYIYNELSKITQIGLDTSIYEYDVIYPTFINTLSDNDYNKSIEHLSDRMYNDEKFKAIINKIDTFVTQFKNEYFIVKWDGKQVNCKFDSSIDGQKFRYYLELVDDRELDGPIEYWQGTDLVFLKDPCDYNRYQEYIGVFANSKNDLKDLIQDICEETEREWEMPGVEDIVMLTKNKPYEIFNPN